MSMSPMSAASSSQLAVARSTVIVSLTGFFLESLLCGALLVVFGTGVWTLLWKTWPYGRSRRDLTLFAASAAMFIIVIAHIGIDGHILVASGILRGADLTSLSHNISALNAPSQLGYLKFTIYVLQTLIADGFMIYRAFMVWTGSWRAISLPLFLYTSSFALGVAIIILDTLPVSLAKLHICQRTYFSMTLLTNVLATVLVMKPLLVSRRGVREYRPKGSQLRTVRWRVMESILQSAAVFTISSLCFTVTTFVSPLGVSFSHYFFPPVVALIFTLTVWRICLASGDPPVPPLHLPLEVNPNAPCHSPYGPGAHARSQSCPSLRTTDREAEYDLEEQSCCSHSGRTTVQPIAIQVSVSTTKTFDGELERASLIWLDRESAKVDPIHDVMTLADTAAELPTVILIPPETGA
ncbi:hypothetical protein L226DRAFT_572906 [Lentinus tigrinus ALCF2SS1-7]|uniref:Uncharacterized protein n=1 Tax=Lentinus tigrinus ALCF2SS1-6 TaxID=1328759 RepID=A0A5C2SB79_9APHY|nr:hypothetical protein L227DRAFT_612673 [Lentinus tigrinus ALCF2SS1-6]RPD72806.1 hypothetical protein L226DRAFT_572906 [Lentinus tigrinus ALCF2SS1-7]